MTTAAELTTGQYADAIKHAWEAFRDHVALAQCIGCGVAYGGLKKDPTVKPSDLHDVCCSAGRELYEAWMAAVAAHVAHVMDHKTTATQPLRPKVSA